MKHKLVAFIAFCLISTMLGFWASAYAKSIFTRDKKTMQQRPPLDKRQENYIEIKDTLKLNTRELAVFNEISVKESWALRPLALELEANHLRLDELNKTKCSWYSKSCKRELKANKAFVENDIKELKRQIWQKKEYYKILYLNQTSRRQDLKLRQIIQTITKNNPKMW